MFRRLALTLSLLSVVAVTIAGIALGLLSRYVEQPAIVDEPYTLQVASGSNLTRVVRQLAARGVVEYPTALLLYARILDRQHIQAGEYRITAQDSLKSLLAKLQNGEVIQYQISFPEGLTFADWMLRLSQESKLQQMSEPDLAEFALPGGHPEGWFFPDTYTFSASGSAMDILRVSHARMKEVLETEWRQRQVGLPYETPYQALIMASIVEKETGAAFERKQIAGVFVRRLQKNMRLQTDPTVIYGLGERYQGNLTRRHLREDTPYNTYVRRGLPPTPIAMPGRAAIHAALNPDDGSALYFVAKGDGTHYFSASLDEHLKAVRRFQLKRVPDYRSSPASETDK